MGNFPNIFFTEKVKIQYGSKTYEKIINKEFDFLININNKEVYNKELTSIIKYIVEYKLDINNFVNRISTDYIIDNIEFLKKNNLVLDNITIMNVLDKLYSYDKFDIRFNKVLQEILKINFLTEGFMKDPYKGCIIKSQEGIVENIELQELIVEEFYNCILQEY